MLSSEYRTSNPYPILPIAVSNLNQSLISQFCILLNSTLKIPNSKFISRVSNFLIFIISYPLSHNPSCSLYLSLRIPNPSILYSFTFQIANSKFEIRLMSLQTLYLFESLVSSFHNPYPIIHNPNLIFSYP